MSKFNSVKGYIYKRENAKLYRWLGKASEREIQLLCDRPDGLSDLTLLFHALTAENYDAARALISHTTSLEVARRWPNVPYCVRYRNQEIADEFKLLIERELVRREAEAIAAVLPTAQPSAVKKSRRI